MHATEPTRRDHAPLQCFEAWTGKFKVSDHNMSSRAALLLAALAVLATTALAANRRMLIGALQTCSSCMNSKGI
jgi:hypothetical protein